MADCSKRIGIICWFRYKDRKPEWNTIHTHNIILLRNFCKYGYAGK